MAETYAFAARALTVGYRGRPLIRDITFSLPRGKILTLIGPNGAGKSTILKTVTRQLAAVPILLILISYPHTMWRL